MPFLPSAHNDWRIDWKSCGARFVDAYVSGMTLPVSALAALADLDVFADSQTAGIAADFAFRRAARTSAVFGDLKRQWIRSRPRFRALVCRADFIKSAAEILSPLERVSGSERARHERRTRYTTKMSKRTSIEVPGLEHVNPIPNASRLGPFLVSGGIFGKDPGTGKVADGVEAQCEQMFANVRKVLEAGGATPEHVIKLNVWLRDMANRPVVNKYWVANVSRSAFAPGAAHLSTPDLRAPLLVECEIMAVITDKK